MEERTNERLSRHISEGADSTERKEKGERVVGSGAEKMDGYMHIIQNATGCDSYMYMKNFTDLQISCLPRVSEVVGVKTGNCNSGH